MKSSTRIAAAKRRLRRIHEDYPLFLKRIECYGPEEKALAISVFEKSLIAAREELEELEDGQDLSPAERD